MFLTIIADTVTPALIECWWGGEAKEKIITAGVLVLLIVLKVKVRNLWDWISGR